MTRVTTPAPVLLDAANAATYAGVRLATLRVWRHRYGLTRWGTTEGNLYDLEELAAIMARRADEVA
jgi:hypothetical protein